MANEGQISIGLQITKIISGIKLIEERIQSGYRFTVTGEKGPLPGAFTVAVAGTDVDLTEITNLGGICTFKNQDDANFVSWGAWDGIEFIPIGELLPGEEFIIRLSRNLGQEYGAGTGTTGAGNKTWRFKADTAPVNVLVRAFDK